MIRNTFQQNLEAAGLRTRSYSGRCMYGKQCLAITTDRGIDFSWIAALLRNCDASEDTLEDIADALEGTRTDSMGLGIVIYWPDIPFEGEETDDDQDESNY